MADKKESLTSFGKRTPTLDELNKAFGTTPAPAQPAASAPAVKDAESGKPDPKRVFDAARQEMIDSGACKNVVGSSCDAKSTGAPATPGKAPPPDSALQPMC